jgi:hypothetical protein
VAASWPEWDWSDAVVEHGGFRVLEADGVCHVTDDVVCL